MNAGSIINFVQGADRFLQAHAKRARRDHEELRLALREVPQVAARLGSWTYLLDDDDRLVDVADLGERLYKLARDIRGSRSAPGHTDSWKALEEGWPHLHDYLRRHRPHLDFVLLRDLIQRVMDGVLQESARRDDLHTIE